MQWVRGGHKVAWLNAWLSGREPLDTVLTHIPELELLSSLRAISLREATLRLATPGDMPQPIDAAHDIAALAAGFRIDLLDYANHIAHSLVTTPGGWLIAPGSGTLLGRDHPQHASRLLDETLISVVNELSRLDLSADRGAVERRLQNLDGLLYGLEWPSLMNEARVSLLKKSARILVILDQAIGSDGMTISASLSNTRNEHLRALAAPARRAAEAAFALER